MISKEHSSNISMEEFVKRNKNIYEGLETKDLSIKILNEKSNGKEISYLTSFNTLAGEVKFQNEVNFIKEKFEYKLVWKDSIIFPQLESTDKVRIDTVEAERGQILDRNGKVLAGKGVASSVGLVPGKIQDKENTIIKLAELLEVDIDVIKNKLSAEWVKDDSFVPIKTIPKVSELELMKINPDENLVKLKENQEELLSIPGVMINDIEVRDYPLKEAASHLVGYIQKVTAEDLEENKGKGYDSNSVIGRSGIESLYEDKLKGLINDNDFSRMYEKKVNERDSKNRKLEELNTVKFERNVVDYEKIIQDFLKKENVTAYMLNSLIEKIEIDQNKQVTIYYKFVDLNTLS